MQTVLLVVELIVAVLLVITILMQKSEGGALGMGGGGGGGMGGLFSPRGAGDALTRTTAILAIVFFVVCLALNLMVAHENKQPSLLDSGSAPVGTTAPQPKPASPAPAQPQPAVPTPH